MNFRVPVKCSGKIEGKGGRPCSITLELPDNAVAGEDMLLFSGPREMTYQTYDRDTADAIKKDDILYISLFTSDHKRK